jgi:hypothetical protein
VAALALSAICLPEERLHSTAAGTASARLTTVLGCQPDLVTDSAEIREEACTAGEHRYRVMTFANAAGREAWLSEAQAYGGVYVVGRKWVVVAATTEPELKSLAAKLGGEVQQGAAHGAGTSAHSDHGAASAE